MVIRYWIITHRDCAFKARNIQYRDNVMARAGGFKEQMSLSAHDQV